MMSMWLSLGNMLIGIPAASATLANTGSPRMTSPHQSSPMTIIFAGPLGRWVNSLKNAVSSALIVRPS